MSSQLTYNRNGKSTQQSQPETDEKKPQEPTGIRIDGFKQVLEMLSIADPEFRASLLRRIETKDPELGRALRMELLHLDI